MLRFVLLSLVFLSSHLMAQVFEGKDQFGRICSLEILQDELISTQLTEECLRLNRSLSQDFSCLERNTLVKMSAERKEFLSSTKYFKEDFLLKSIDSDLYDAYEVDRSSAQKNGASLIVEFSKTKPALFYFSESSRKEFIECRL